MTVEISFARGAAQQSVERAAEQAAQQAGEQARDQIREQVRRDVQRALQDARAAREEAGRLIVPPVPPLPPNLPNGLGVLRGPDGQVVISTGTGQAGVPFPDIPPQVVDISIAFFVTLATIFIGTPLARAFARRMDRKTAPAAAPAPEVVSRLDRIEQAVDSIAVEVERISEGQRYVTKVMAETRALPGPNEAAANDLRMAERASGDRVR